MRIREAGVSFRQIFDLRNERVWNAAGGDVTPHPDQVRFAPQSGRRPTRRACLLSTVESGHPIYVANECTSLLAATPGV